MKNLTHSTLLFTVVTLSAFSLAAKPVIEEGLFLDGVEGVIRKVETVDVWSFVPDAKVVLTDDVSWPAQKSINLLPCSVLEQITSLAGEDNEINVRLWGLFTTYNQNNYLYSVYFLPVKEDAGLKPTTTTAQKKEGESDETPKADEQEDSIIPTEILKQIKSQKAPDLKKFQQVAVVTGDINLIGRAGYLKQNKNVKFFQQDGFGQKVNLHRYLLLPCEMLEVAEHEMQKSPGRQRYSVSGLVTSYKGRNYMLLRRTVRTYTNGNFTQ